MKLKKIYSGRKQIAIALLLVFTQSFIGCSSWRILPVDNISSEVENVSLSDKYIIIHKLDSTQWHMKNAVAFESRNIIYSTLLPLDSLEKEKNTTYLHLYISDDVQTDGADVQLPFSSIQKMEYDKWQPDTGKTILAIGGITAGIGLFLVMAWTMSGGGNFLANF